MNVKLKLLFGVVSVSLAFGVDCMNKGVDDSEHNDSIILSRMEESRDLQTNIEKLDVYKGDSNTLSEIELTEAYEYVLQRIVNKIVVLKKLIREAACGNKECEEERKENDNGVDLEALAATRDLCLERLQDYSSEGQFGQKILKDEKIVKRMDLVKDFKTLMAEIEGQSSGD
jgi:hypothetical protein